MQLYFCIEYKLVQVAFAQKELSQVKWQLSGAEQLQMFFSNIRCCSFREMALNQKRVDLG